MGFLLTEWNNYLKLIGYEFHYLPLQAYAHNVNIRIDTRASSP